MLHIYQGRGLNYNDRISVNSGEAVTIQAKLFDEFSTPYNLAGYTVTFRVHKMDPWRETIARQGATVTNSSEGEVEFTINSGILIQDESETERTFYRGWFFLEDGSEEIRFPDENHGAIVIQSVGPTETDDLDVVLDAKAHTENLRSETAQDKTFVENAVNSLKDVNELTQSISSPPTQTEVVTIQDKLNEVITTFNS